ncbi:GNAT family N-acetyltransferase [Massilia sp. CF038]|uniref:GNAT family N-acetyltransferase n=1 Tax=Massilia sp. CF038 TaxID=1881045 RepID=UPI000920F22B|nr:GNAT family N-acetyltransferase [Massilia sp. CF038]SHH41776.1 Acetyltransferase (GNAT) domain-containing protein [Massilia sp. CF038]
MKWRLTPASEFGAHANAWNALHAQCQASPMLAYEFVAPLLTEFGSGVELLAHCEDGGRTIAMAVITPQGKGRWASFQPAQAPIGLWLQAHDLALAPLLETLMGALPGVPLVFGLTQCDPDLLPRPAPSSQLRTMDYIDTAKITLRGSFDDYWNARGKNLRSNLKKQRAKLEKDGVALRMQVSRSAQDVAAAVADYGRLESAGWKAGGGTAVSADNDQGRYYRAMLEGFCRRDAGSIYRYWFDQQLVAMDLCIEDAQQIIVLKTTYDESVPKSLSPTLLMREEACRSLFDSGRFARLEFYGKVMEWHTRWTDEVRTLYHVNYYRWPALGRLHALWQSRRSRTPKEDHVS